jgi:hypothetical protein
MNGSQQNRLVWLRQPVGGPWQTPAVPFGAAWLQVAVCYSVLATFNTMNAGSGDPGPALARRQTSRRIISMPLIQSG